MLVMIPDTHRHVDDEAIERYSVGETPEGEVARLEEHLLICESCRRRLAETDVYGSSMQRASAELRRAPLEHQRHPWFLPRLVPTLAAVAVAVLVTVVGLRLVKPGAPMPAFAVNLEATRGAGIEAKAPPGRPLVLRLDVTGLPVWPSYRLEMVDRIGNRVWQGATPGASVPPARPGVYFVRVYSPSGELLREYGLEVESRR